MARNLTFTHDENREEMAISEASSADELSPGSDVNRLLHLAVSLKDLQDVLESVEAQVDDIRAKPLHIREVVARISALRRSRRDEGHHRSNQSRRAAEMTVHVADENTTNLWSIVRTSSVAELEQLFEAGIIDIGDAMTAAEAALLRASDSATDAAREASVLLEQIQTRSSEIDEAQRASRRLIEGLIDG